MIRRHVPAFDRMLSIDEAINQIVATTLPVADTETVPLRLGFNRDFAADIVTPLNVPPFDAPAMDGFAFRQADRRSFAQRGRYLPFTVLMQ